MKAAHAASGAELVTVAVRRIDLTAKGDQSLLHWIGSGITLLAQHRRLLQRRRGQCAPADLARELGMSDLVKVEVIGDQRTLFPDTAELIVACRELVKDGFTVLPYTNDDPIAARKLEEVGAQRRPSCAARRADRRVASACAIR